MASRDNFKQANQRAKELEARIPRAGEKLTIKLELR
jgi:hypothetical protein